MKTTLLFVSAGLLVSWASVLSVGEAVDGADLAGLSDSKNTSQLSQGSLKEIVELLLLDGKNELFQYSVVGDASDVENCGHTQGGDRTSRVVCVCVRVRCV